MKNHAELAIASLAAAAITAAVFPATPVAASDSYGKSSGTTTERVYAPSAGTFLGIHATPQQDQQFLTEFKSTLASWGGGKWPLSDAYTIDLGRKAATALQNGTPEYATVTHQTWAAMDRAGGPPPSITGPASAALVQSALDVYVLTPHDQEFLAALKAHSDWPVDPQYSIVIGHTVYQDMVQGTPFTVQDTNTFPPPTSGPYVGHAVVKLNRKQATDLQNAVITGYHVPPYAIKFVSPAPTSSPPPSSSPSTTSPS